MIRIRGLSLASVSVAWGSVVAVRFGIPWAIARTPRDELKTSAVHSACSFYLFLLDNFGNKYLIALFVHISFFRFKALFDLRYLWE